MRRISLLAVTMVLVLAGSLTAQDEPPGLSWSVRSLFEMGGPTFSEDYSDTYGSAYGGTVGAGAHIRGLDFLEPRLDLRFDIASISDDPLYYLWMLRPELGLSLRAPILSWFAPYLFGSVGYGIAGVNYVPSSSGGTASGLTWGSGAGLEFSFGRFSIFAEFAYNAFVDLFGGLLIRVGGGWTFDEGRMRSAESQQERAPVEVVPEPLQHSETDSAERTAVNAEDVDITFVSFDMWPVFPILYKYYDEQPIGTATIANTSNVTLADVEVRLDMSTYIDNAKLSGAFASLEPGAQEEVELYALFNDQVIYMTEGDKIAATVTVEFKVDGERASDQETVTVEFYDRNALRWDDTRKIATFVTAKDVELQRWAKHLAALVRRDANAEVSSNFQTGMMVFTAMAESELAYVIDPSSAYEQLSQNPFSVDYVQFPRQTFDFRAGDCDDLSVCYATLLEAAGVPSAFVTIPGHIFLAFKLEWDDEQARKRFNQWDNLVFREEDDSVWVPVETTLLEEDFITAWSVGARQWRENDSRGFTEFVRTADAWDTYLPVQFVDNTTFERPDDEAVSEAFRSELTTFIRREVADREARLRNRISEDPENVRFRNNLGALYARYGMYEEAREQFEAVVSVSDHAPALVNLGNMAYLDGDLGLADEYYDRALRAEPEYSLALLGAARVNHELENYGTAQTHYDKLKDASPQLAQQFEYLELRGEQAARASDAAQASSFVVWGDEE